MKLLTLNCHSWQEKNQLDKIKYIAKTIFENQYDVVALQEVSHLIESKSINDTIKEDNFVYLLNNEIKKLGCDKYKFYWDMSHIGFDIYEEGICILTKLEVIEKSSFYVSKSCDIKNPKSRKILKLTLNHNKEKIDFYSCHIGWFEDDDFKFQVDNLFKNSERVSFYMGDFNNDANKKNEGYDYILSKGVFDTFDISKNKDEGITVKGKIDGWENNKNDMRIDLILCNKHIDVIHSKVIFNGENKDIVSDHFGVEVLVNI